MNEAFITTLENEEISEIADTFNEQYPVFSSESAHQKGKVPADEVLFNYYY